MPNFDQTPIQIELPRAEPKICSKKLLPLVVEDEEAERFRPELIRKMGELGLTGIPIPEALGGSGLGYQEYIVAIEELSTANIGYAISVAVTGLTQVILNLFGNSEQKNKCIPPLAKGEAIGAFSLSEAGSGSDAANLRTSARKKGKDYIIRGTKLWTTQGDIADTVILLARTGGPGPSGISAFIVEKGTPGFSYGKREKRSATILRIQ